MTYQSLPYGYEAAPIARTEIAPFGERVAVLLVALALFFFMTGVIGYWGIVHARPNDAYIGILQGSMIATAIDFVAILFFLAADRRSGKR